MPSLSSLGSFLLLAIPLLILIVLFPPLLTFILNQLLKLLPFKISLTRISLLGFLFGTGTGFTGLECIPKPGLNVKVEEFYFRVSFRKLFKYIAVTTQTRERPVSVTLKGFQITLDSKFVPPPSKPSSSPNPNPFSKNQSKPPTPTPTSTGSLLSNLQYTYLTLLTRFISFSTSFTLSTPFLSSSFNLHLHALHSIQPTNSVIGTVEVEGFKVKSFDGGREEVRVVTGEFRGEVEIRKVIDKVILRGVQFESNVEGELELEAVESCKKLLSPPPSSSPTPTPTPTIPTQPPTKPSSPTPPESISGLLNISLTLIRPSSSHHLPPPSLFLSTSTTLTKPPRRKFLILESSNLITYAEEGEAYSVYEHDFKISHTPSTNLTSAITKFDSADVEVYLKHEVIKFCIGNNDDSKPKPKKKKKVKEKKNSNIIVNIPTLTFTYVDSPSNHVYNNIPYTDPVTYSIKLKGLKVNDKSDLVSTSSETTMDRIDVLVKFTPMNLPGNVREINFKGFVEVFKILKTSDDVSTQFISFDNALGNYNDYKIIEAQSVTIKYHDSLKRIIDITGLGSIKYNGEWHWSLMNLIKIQGDTERYIKYELMKSTPSGKKIMIVNLKGDINAECDFGCNKILNVSGNMNVNLKDIPGRSKPSVMLDFKDMNINMEGGGKVRIKEFKFWDVFEVAAYDEVEMYTDKHEGNEIDRLVTDAGGKVLKEIVDFEMNRFEVELPESFFMGAFVDRLLDWKTALFKGLKDSGVSKSGKGGYQLMSISVKLSGSFTLVEPNLERFKILINNLTGSITRNTPPSKTLKHINKLDSAVEQQIYALNQGGEVDVRFSGVKVIIYPGNEDMPLVGIEEGRVRGYLFLTPLSSDTPGLPPKKSKIVKLLSDNDSGFRTTITSSGVPVKVYLDITLKTKSFNVAYGPIIAHHIDDFIHALDRCLPPSADPEASRRQVKIGWWDNLRFWVHGRVEIAARRFRFRWLLDFVEEKGRCLLFESEEARIVYMLGKFGLTFHNLILSLPRTSYPFLEIRAKRRGTTVDRGRTQSSYEDAREDQNYVQTTPAFEDKERHEILILPVLNVDVKVAWNLHRPGIPSSAYNHHSSYTRSIILNDRLAWFRSDSMNLDFDVKLNKGIGSGCWIALRGDVLPWFYHKADFGNTRTSSVASLAESKISPPTPPITNLETNPPPSLEVSRLKVKAYANEIKCGMWHGVFDADGLCIVVPVVNVLSVSEKLSDEAGLVSNETQIDLGGVKATLLDVVDCYEWEAPGKLPSGGGGGGEIFTLLSKWHSQITELDYIVEANSLIILDHPLSQDSDESSTTFSSVSELFMNWERKEVEEEEGVTNWRPILNNFKANHKELRPPTSYIPIFQRSAQKAKPNKDPATPSSPPRKQRTSPQKRATIGFAPPPLAHNASFSELSSAASARDLTEDLDADIDEDESFVTWTVLVAGMRLLWTLDIRDAVMGIVGDLLHTLELMSLQKKFDTKVSRSRTNTMERSNSVGSQVADLKDFGGGLMLHPSAGIFMGRNDSDLSSDSDDEGPSYLNSLLRINRKDSTASSVMSMSEEDLVEEQRLEDGILGIKRPDSLEIPAPKPPPRNVSTGAGSVSRRASSSLVGLDMRHSSTSNYLNALTPTSASTANTPHNARDDAKATVEKLKRREEKRERVEAKMKEAMSKYRVTFQVHLLNPQFQLHSNQTSGSVVISSQGAYIEGRDFLKLVRDNSLQFGERAGVVDIESSVNLLKKSEVRYVLDRVEAYAMPTNVDLNAGLQWLELVSMEEIARREKREAEEGRKEKEAALKRAAKIELEIADNTKIGGRGGGKDEVDVFEEYGRINRKGSQLDRMFGIAGEEDTDVEDFDEDEDDDKDTVSVEEKRGGEEEDKFDDSRVPQTPVLSPKKHETAASSFQKMTFVPPSLLRKMWEEFTIRSHQVTYSKPLMMAIDSSGDGVSPFIGDDESVFEGDLDNANYLPQEQAPATIDSLILDVPELSFLLDSEQFFTTLDVVRHVLLAPPPQKREYEFVRHDFEAGGRETTVSLYPRPTSVRSGGSMGLESPTNRMGRAQSGSMAEGVARRAAVRRESVSLRRPSTTSHVSSERDEVEGGKGGGGGGRWEEIKRTIDKIDTTTKRGRAQMKELMQDVMSELEGVKMESSQVRAIKWTVSRASWRIKKKHESMTAVADDDVEVVLTNVEGNHEFFEDGSLETVFELENAFIRSRKPGAESIMWHDPTSVLRSTIEGKKTPCQRCGAEFDPEHNNVTSCHYHADAEGVPGVFRLGSGGWSCCKAPYMGAKGCNSRPHVGKEHIVMARVYNLPRLVCKQTELSIYKHIELSFYPGTKYTLNVQMTRAISKLFMNYFLGEGLDNTIGQHNTTAEMAENVRDTLTHGIEDIAEKAKRKAKSLTALASHATEERKEILFGGLSGSNSSKGKSGDSGKDVKASENAVTLKSDVEKNEVVYISHIRIGDINSRVSLSGFALDIDRYGLKVSPFQRSKKVGDWKHLIRKWVGHTVREVSKSAASTGLKKVKEKMFGSTGGVIEGGGVNSTREFIQGSARSKSPVRGREEGEEEEGEEGEEGGVDASRLFGEKPKKSKRGKLKKLLGWGGKK
ncbi:hypothetical protein TrLO_g884 [Triparma laevis f. longispina]|uniref:Uncharacterized protein n=1 Tax=Triparma laevis f. longispina TaxID=1714387 RepID=A0A9W6ZBH1_9STRA|nr:hypothetical protein TrLO_g884 [Triparma laevis f. longispina]